MSQVMGKRPDLFTTYLQVSSQWDGEFEPVVERQLLVLDVKEHEYFTDQGMSNEHGGGGLFAYDEEIMGWLFSH